MVWCGARFEDGSAPLVTTDDVPSRRRVEGRCVWLGGVVWCGV